MVQDEIYMQRAIELAQLGKSQVSPNPLVGAVITLNGQIIGEGWHKKYGTAHAEVNAVASVENKASLKEATIYVTLEPCAHHGKTPPCVDLILKHQFKRVVIGAIDSNPLVGGKSVEKLHAANITVTTGVLEKECQHLARHFLQTINTKLPYITLKFANSSNNIMGDSTKQIWLSDPISKRISHQLRHENDAILIGKNTFDIDNPKLNVRFNYNSNIRKIILGKPNNIDALSILDSSWVIVCEEELPIGLFTQLKTNPKDIKKVLETLRKELQIQSIIIEGGKTVLETFINSNLWHEAIQFHSPNTASGDIQAPVINSANSTTTKFYKDNIIIYYNQPTS